ncbi:MAG: lipid-A-disaccharide synthase, partial [Anaerolineales bacterium]|nr:lipid-A-disaccharide synthase [Anaerolineales bacterium]
MKNKTQRSLLVVCGETSGEAHAAGVIRHLRELSLDSEWKVFGSGGEKLRQQGTDIMLDVARLSAIGPKAALGNLGNYLSLRKRILARVRRDKPDLALLVDFPDFNLPLARKLKKAGIPVCYFISPQLWAWRKSRVKQIKKYVDLMLVIFPFEEAFYRAHQVNAVYVGNPTAARLSILKKRDGFARKTPRDKPIVALLPGSRLKEVDLLLPVELAAAEFVSRETDTRFLVFRAPEIPSGLLEERIEQFSGSCSLDIEVVDSDYELLAGSDCAIVKSGTSTLETLLLGVPFAMIYKLPLASYILLRAFVWTRTFCLANLVAEERLVPEFVQRDATGRNIGTYIKTLLDSREKMDNVRDSFSRVERKLGDQDGDRRAAEEIIET